MIHTVKYLSALGDCLNVTNNFWSFLKWWDLSVKAQSLWVKQTATKV